MDANKHESGNSIKNVFVVCVFFIRVRLPSIDRLLMVFLFVLFYPNNFFNGVIKLSQTAKRFNRSIEWVGEIPRGQTS